MEEFDGLGLLMIVYASEIRMWTLLHFLINILEEEQMTDYWIELWFIVGWSCIQYVKKAQINPKLIPSDDDVIVVPIVDFIESLNLSLWLET